MATDSDNPEIAALQAQVRRLGELVDALYRHLGIGQLDAAGMGAGAPPPDVVDAITAGNTIMAIKLWREHTGADLRGAKDAVEQLARSMGR